jgi:hypothetical protein
MADEIACCLQGQGIDDMHRPHLARRLPFFARQFRRQLGAPSHVAELVFVFRSPVGLLEIGPFGRCVGFRLNFSIERRQGAVAYSLAATKVVKPMPS